MFRSGVFGLGNKKAHRERQMGVRRHRAPWGLMLIGSSHDSDQLQGLLAADVSVCRTLCSLRLHR